MQSDANKCIVKLSPQSRYGRNQRSKVTEDLYNFDYFVFNKSRSKKLPTSKVSDRNNSSQNGNHVAIDHSSPCLDTSDVCVTNRSIIKKESSESSLTVDNLVDVDKVLKLISSNCSTTSNHNAQSPKSQAVFRTYTNPRKSANRNQKFMESFGLPDDSIFSSTPEPKQCTINIDLTQTSDELTKNGSNTISFATELPENESICIIDDVKCELNEEDVIFVDSAIDKITQVATNVETVSYIDNHLAENTEQHQFSTVKLRGRKKGSTTRHKHLANEGNVFKRITRSRSSTENLNSSIVKDEISANQTASEIIPLEAPVNNVECISVQNNCSIKDEILLLESPAESALSVSNNCNLERITSNEINDQTCSKYQKAFTQKQNERCRKNENTLSKNKEKCSNNESLDPTIIMKQNASTKSALSIKALVSAYKEKFSNGVIHFKTVSTKSSSITKSKQEYDLKANKKLASFAQNSPDGSCENDKICVAANGPIDIQVDENDLIEVKPNLLEQYKTKGSEDTTRSNQLKGESSTENTEIKQEIVESTTNGYTSSFERNTYKVGDLAWAKMAGHPFWPCLITKDPASQRFQKAHSSHWKYHVTFFGDCCRRAWVSVLKLKHFAGSNDIKTILSKERNNRVTKRKLLNFRRGVSEAEQLITKSVTEKLDFFKLFIAQLAKKPLDKEERKTRNEKEKSNHSLNNTPRLLTLDPDESSLNISNDKCTVVIDKKIPQIIDGILSKDEVKSEKCEIVVQPPLKKRLRNSSALTYIENDTERKIIVPETKRKTRSSIRVSCIENLNVTRIKTDTSLDTSIENVTDETSVKKNMNKSPNNRLIKSEPRSNLKACSKVSVKSEVSDSLCQTSVITDTPVILTLDTQRELFKRNQLFRNISRSKSCQICGEGTQVFLCKGPCKGTYHYSCALNAYMYHNEDKMENEKPKFLHITAESEPFLFECAPPPTMSSTILDCTSTKDQNSNCSFVDTISLSEISVNTTDTSNIEDSGKTNVTKRKRGRPRSDKTIKNEKLHQVANGISKSLQKSRDTSKNGMDIKPVENHVNNKSVILPEKKKPGRPRKRNLHTDQSPVLNHMKDNKSIKMITIKDSSADCSDQSLEVSTKRTKANMKSQKSYCRITKTKRNTVEKNVKSRKQKGCNSSPNSSYELVATMKEKIRSNISKAKVLKYINQTAVYSLNTIEDDIMFVQQFCTEANIFDDDQKSHSIGPDNDHIEDTTPSTSKVIKEKRTTSKIVNNNSVKHENESISKGKEISLANTVTFRNSDIDFDRIEKRSKSKSISTKNHKNDKCSPNTATKAQLEKTPMVCIPRLEEVLNRRKSGKKSITKDTVNDVLNGEMDAFKCGWCLHNKLPTCFVCNKEKCPKTGVDLRFKCKLSHCSQYYHIECLKNWPHTQWMPGKSDEETNFTCPQHVCHTCASENPRAPRSLCSNGTIAKCIKCPVTYHSYNFCIPAGTKIVSHSQIICPRHSRHTKSNKMQTVNTNWCFICSRGGNLFCCETCPACVHSECLPISLNKDEKFYCEDCQCGRLPLYDEIVWAKLGVYRWWPALILFPDETPLSVQRIPHDIGDFVVKFFGTHNHYWTNRGRTFLFQEGDTGHCYTSKKSYEFTFKKAIEEAIEAHALKTEFKQSLLSKLHQEPPPYVRIKSNRAVGNVKLSDGDLSNTTSCNCNPNDAIPCGPDSACINRLLMTECNPEICPAGTNCNNQYFEQRLYPPLVPHKTNGRGWGLKTLVPLQRGQFVIEYVGEMIDDKEYQRRIKLLHEAKAENYYFLTIDKDRTLDAGPKGNLARFMNHSCVPNCETQKWTVNGGTRVGLFATEDIPVDTELTFNYNLECVGEQKKICTCGASLCSGFIGVKLKMERIVKLPKIVDTVKKSSGKGRKRKPNQKSEKVQHADEKTTDETVILKTKCFVCKRSSKRMILCTHPNCTKEYHWKCVGAEKSLVHWKCPRHYCIVCKRKSYFHCDECVKSYCKKHHSGRFKRNGLCKSYHRHLKANKVPNTTKTAKREKLSNQTFKSIKLQNRKEVNKKQTKRRKYNKKKTKYQKDVALKNDNHIVPTSNSKMNHITPAQQMRFTRTTSNGAFFGVWPFELWKSA